MLTSVLCYFFLSFITGIAINECASRKITARYWLTCYLFPLWWVYGLFYAFYKIVPILIKEAFPKE
jgi:hypothetical protein